MMGCCTMYPEEWKNGSEILDAQHLFKFKKNLIKRQAKNVDRDIEKMSPHFYAHITGNISQAIYTDV